MQNNESFNKLFNGFRVRPAVETEIEELIQVVREVFVEYDMIFDALDELPDYVRFGEYYAENVPSVGRPFLCTVLAPGEEGVIAGCIAQRFDEDGPCLSRVYLRPQYRAQGVGKWMVREFMDLLRQQGFDSMHLWTDTRFVPAHGMYEKVGFRMAGEIRSLHDVNRSFEWKMVASLR
jgi:GNAT superfamily N-acetyltransferase